MTMAAFICVVFISLPWNKIRLLTIFIAAALAVVSAAVDFNYLQGYLLDVEMPETVNDALFVLGAVVISWVVNIVCRKILRSVDNKYGDKAEERFIEVTEKIKDSVLYLPKKVKAKVLKK